MSLFTIGDLHLSLGVPNKPMNIFHGWENHVELLEKNWRENIAESDTVVLAGDFSWAMTLAEAKLDFEFVQNLPGKKILLKGNHDYWWNSLKKMNDFFAENGFDSFSILQNNCFEYEEYGICGTRGWVNMPDEPADAKVLAREVLRLEASIENAEKLGLEPMVFLHYPPVYGNVCNYDMLEVLFKHNVKNCYYGHLHGNSCKNSINGDRDGTDYRLISSDYLQFNPYKVK